MEPFDPTGSIRILGYDFKVEQLPASDHRLVDEGRKGFCNQSISQIGVCDHLAEDHKREVVFHEIFHVIDEAVDADLNESQVTRLARATFAVFRDNPQYMKRLLFDE